MYPSDLHVMMKREQKKDLDRELKKQELIALARRNQAQAESYVNSPRATPKSGWRERFWKFWHFGSFHLPRGMGHGRA